jgi:hypothetical protein
MVPVSYYFALSAILFALGALGVLIRRNAIILRRKGTDALENGKEEARSPQVVGEK